MMYYLKHRHVNYPKLLFVLLSCIAILGNFSCEKDYDYIPPPPDPNQPVDSISFSADIFPIFSASCNSAPCHLNNANAPDLTTVSIAYAQMWVNDAGNILVDTTNAGANAANSILYKRMISTTSNKMPPQGILPASETSKVLSWIQQGANNN